jgi:RimJ/RimL family protein N-acetyltransferase
MPQDLPIDLGDLTLRRLRHTDYADLLAYYSDPDVARYQQWGPMTADELAAIFEGQGSVLPGDPGVPLILAVELKAEQRVIGDCSLTVTDPMSRQAEIGFCFHPHQRGRGYSTRAVRAALEFAFGSLDVRRVVAATDVRNERSWRLLERIGMRREGHFRQCAFVKGEWIDDYLYAMLADEWRTD